MGTLTKSYAGQILTNDANVSTWSKIEKWCDSLEDYRFPIAGALIIIQGCIVAPPLLLLISYFNSTYSDISVLLFALFTFAVLVSNISILPMRYIVGVFACNLLVTLAIAAVHLIPLLR
ncbi:MAG: hypothetical protein NVV82_16425 [Sporocytophaga sp.]|nr:hypothetical protein [Sporocytophaga sp.]